MRTAFDDVHHQYDETRDVVEDFRHRDWKSVVPIVEAEIENLGGQMDALEIAVFGDDQPD